MALAVAAPAAAQTIDRFATSFGFGASQTVEAIALQGDGRIVVGGEFQLAGINCAPNSCPIARSRIARLNPDGTIDTFNPGAGGPVRALAIQPDGKILVAGAFSTLGGGGAGTTTRRCLGRVNPDGTLDAAFDPVPIAPFCTGQAVIVQPNDGKIIVATVTQVKDNLGNPVVREGIARLNPDGSVDASYHPSVAGTDTIRTMLLDPQGRLIVGGSFTHVGANGSTPTPRLGLARFLPDGSVDGSFDPGVTGPVTGTVLSLALQADGKILVGGSFTGIGGGSGVFARRGMARVSDTGAVDSFDPNVAIDAFNAGSVQSIAVQADGRLLIAGVFLTVGGVARSHVARLETGGSVDATFADVIGPELAGANRFLTLQPDGKILVGGRFDSSSGAIRNGIARYHNTSVASDAVSVTAGGSTITWLRGGTAPEIDFAAFEVSTDGLVWTAIGASRVAGGWQQTGLSLPSNAVVRTRSFLRGMRGSVSSGLVRNVALPPGGTILANGAFDSGASRWSFFATPDLSYIATDVSTGALRFYRVAPPPGTANQAVAINSTGFPVPASTALTATLSLANTDTVRKRVSILIHDSNFTDLAVCTFWLAPGASPAVYGVATHTTQSWTDATVSIYAASANGPGNTTGFYVVDNVSLAYQPAGSTASTGCQDPTAPVPPGGAPGTELLVNGDFGSGALTPGWETFGQITHNVTNNVFQYYRTAGTPAGVVLQRTGQTTSLGEIVTASFELGNASFVRVRVTVLLHDTDFSDLAACTFWIPAGQPLSSYTMRTFSTKAWTNATLSVYPSTVSTVFWNQLDTASFRRTPGGATSGTVCVEPGGIVP